MIGTRPPWNPQKEEVELSFPKSQNPKAENESPWQIQEWARIIALHHPTKHFTPSITRKIPIIFHIVTPTKCQAQRGARGRKRTVHRSKPSTQSDKTPMQAGSVCLPSLQPRVILLVGRIAIVVGFPVSTSGSVVGRRIGYAVHALQKLNAQPFSYVECLERQK